MYKGSIIFAVDSFEITVSTPVFKDENDALLYCNTANIAVQKKPLGLILTGVGLPETLLTDDEITVSNLKQESLGKTRMKKCYGIKELVRHKEVRRGVCCMKTSVIAVPDLGEAS